MRGIKLRLITFFSVLLVGSFAGADDWAHNLRNLGVNLSPNDYLTLRQFESQGNTERQVIDVNLIQLAKSYPRQAQEWINGASTILDKTFKVSTTHESFKRTRTSFLKAVMAVLWAEGNNPKTLTASSMVSVFEKYYHSPKKFYDATAVFFAYSNLVNKNLVSAGPRALKEAAIQFKIANYKNNLDGAELSQEEETLLRSSTRHVASISP